MSCYRRDCMIRRQCTSADPMRCHYEETCESKVEEDLTIIQRGGLMSGKEFVDMARDFDTNLGVFIKLFNMWQSMTKEERGKAIEIAMKNGSLEVK